MSDSRDQWETLRHRVAKPGETFRHMTLIRHKQTGIFRLAGPTGALIGISKRDAERMVREGEGSGGDD